MYSIFGVMWGDINLLPMDTMVVIPLDYWLTLSTLLSDRDQIAVS